MAEDLKRFLTHQTIQARRPSFTQRLVRWSRRNRRTLTLATVLLLVALTLSTLICAGAYSVAKRQREEAETERAQAQENLQLAIEAVDQMYTGVATQWLASDTVLSVLQAHYLEQASSIYKRIIRNTQDADANKQLLAILWERIGTIQMALDEMGETRQMSEARQALAGAIRFNNQLLEASPDDASIRERLAKCHNNLARTLGDLGNNEESLRAIDTAQQHMQQLAGRFPDKPDYQHGLAVNDLLRAELLLSIGQPDKAERWARQGGDTAQGLAQAEVGRTDRVSESAEDRIVFDAIAASTVAHEDSRKVCDETLRLCGFMRIDYWDHPYVQQAEALLVREAAELDLLAGQVESAVGHFRRSLQLQIKSLRGRVKPSHWLTAYVWGEFGRNKLDEAPRARDEGYEEPDKFCTYIETQIRMAPALHTDRPAARGRADPGRGRRNEPVPDGLLRQGSVPRRLRQQLGRAGTVAGRRTTQRSLDGTRACHLGLVVCTTGGTGVPPIPQRIARGGIRLRLVRREFSRVRDGGIAQLVGDQEAARPTARSITSTTGGSRRWRPRCGAVRSNACRVPSSSAPTPMPSIGSI